MQATNTDTLFQSDAELAKSAARQEKAARTARTGSPIKLSSKPLDLAIRPRKSGSPTAFVAESGFTARNIDLKVSKATAGCVQARQSGNDADWCRRSSFIDACSNMHMRFTDRKDNSSIQRSFWSCYFFGILQDQQAASRAFVHWLVG